MLDREQLVVECVNGRDRGAVVSTIVESSHTVLDGETDTVSLEETFADVVDG